MAGMGEEIVTKDGEVFVKVNELPKKFENANMSTVAQLLDQININLGLLVDATRWVGNYISIDDDIEPNKERMDYKFNFPVRYMRIYADQPIQVQLNDVGNPVINIPASEMPFVLENMFPSFYIRTVYITTGTLATKVKILAMG